MLGLTKLLIMYPLITFNKRYHYLWNPTLYFAIYNVILQYFKIIQYLSSKTQWYVTNSVILNMLHLLQYKLEGHTSGFYSRHGYLSSYTQKNVYSTICMKLNCYFPLFIVLIKLNIIPNMHNELNSFLH